MSSIDPQTITRLLHEAQAGDATALETLLPIVYEELRSLAAPIFKSERKNHTLQPTAVVHEAWLKVEAHIDHIADRIHFFAIASRAMRQVLADHARGRMRSKRSGARERVTLDGSLGSLVDTSENAVGLVELDDLLTRLSSLQPRHARVVELRVLGGLTIAETAEVLGVGHSTVEGDWFTAKGWLRAELGRDR